MQHIRFSLPNVERFGLLGWMLGRVKEEFILVCKVAWIRLVLKNSDIADKNDIYHHKWCKHISDIGTVIVSILLNYSWISTYKEPPN